MLNPKLKTWTFEDRSDWPDFDLGWGNEPDKAEWRDEATGLPCIARRGSSGAWCGYVGVAPTHPLHSIAYGECPDDCAKYQEKGYCDHCPESSLCVHGGITFSNPCRPNEDGHGICHVPEEGEDDDVWWFGFDCAHAGDFSPAYYNILRDTSVRMGPANASLLEEARRGDTYRTLAYAQEQCAHLAAQLAERG
jgi:hypothetical protein